MGSSVGVETGVEVSMETVFEAPVMGIEGEQADTASAHKTKNKLRMIVIRSSSPQSLNDRMYAQRGAFRLINKVDEPAPLLY